jgi:hypothetical protein
MGKTLSKIRGHLITRPVQRFNIEHRTEKLLARDKPIQAPKFQTDIDLLEKVRRENPEILEETRNRDPLLEDRLKQVCPHKWNLHLFTFSNSYDLNRIQ